MFSPETFSLFNLPDKALKHVARCLDSVEIFCLSIVTERTKQLIKSLNIPDGRFVLEICNDVSIVVLVLRPLEIRWNYDDPESLSIHTSGEDFRDIRPRKLTKEGFHLGDWIRHLISIFNQEDVKRILLRSIPETVIPKPFFDSITGIDIRILVVFNRNVEHTTKDYRSLLPYVKHLCISRRSSENCESIQEVIIQNYDYLSVHVDIRLSLDHYLLMNSSYIGMQDEMSQSKVNRFIRHWIQGSNPRLKVLDYWSNGIPKLQKILKRITHQDVSDNQVRTFEIRDLAPSREKDIIVNSGYNIRRVDGTQATIHIRVFPPIGFRLFLLVWN